MCINKNSSGEKSRLLVCTPTDQPGSNLLSGGGGNPQFWFLIYRGAHSWASVLTWTHCPQDGNEGRDPSSTPSLALALFSGPQTQLRVLPGQSFHKQTLHSPRKTWDALPTLPMNLLGKNEQSCGKATRWMWRTSGSPHLMFMRKQNCGKMVHLLVNVQALLLLSNTTEQPGAVFGNVQRQWKSSCFIILVFFHKLFHTSALYAEVHFT